VRIVATAGKFDPVGFEQFIEGVSMNKSTQTWLLLGAAGAALYYLYTKNKNPNANMGGKDFGVSPCGGQWCQVGSSSGQVLNCPTPLVVTGQGN
jgi:hypothetical protein